MYRAVREAQPDVAHFHDPELVLVGALLKLSGIKVIYDVHEDVPRQILGKSWIPLWARRPVAAIVERIEWIAAHIFDGVVAATPTISARFPAEKTITVQNFPILDELRVPKAIPFSKRQPSVVYVGGITAARGALEMVQALELVPEDRDVRLLLGGRFMSDELEKKMCALSGWSRVVPYGWVGRDSVAELLGNAQAGLVLLHPTPNYIDALPVKMFEYMAAGIPVVASDFPLWREIIEEACCGLLVDPLNPNDIAVAIGWILDNPQEAAAMGRRGREAVELKYSWESESKILINFYKKVLSAGF